jgi:hypothetical protein
MAAAPGGSQLWAAWRAASATEKLCALVLVLACVHLRDWLARQPSQDAKPAAALQVVHALCRTRWRSPTLLLLAACGVLLLSVPADIAALLVAVALAVMPGLLDGVARRASKFADVSVRCRTGQQPLGCVHGCMPCQGSALTAHHTAYTSVT